MASQLNISEITKRPGVIIQEIDNSVRLLPAQTELNNVVIGFSRKGPVNRAVKIETPQQLLDTFGDIDRQMEKKGCFFHRTIATILSNAPVFAVNLLKTDDNLDQMDFKSISLAANLNNDIVRKGPYSNFFNRADFWYRDVESFITLADKTADPKHVMHITNMFDKKTSVFIFKDSTLSGYDDTLDIYYGSVSKVPAYLHPTDQAKDYILSMLIVSGDWSDYKTLSVDPRWSKYFNANGLRKNTLDAFRLDPSVNVLRYYTELSVIPYFKDINNRDLFIETVVNRDTESHGIFVAYDLEKVEGTDYPTGLLDLVGSSLVGSDTETIEYISYKETVTETLTFAEKVLNRAGNAFGHYGLEMELKITNQYTPFITTITGATSDLVQVEGLSNYILNGNTVNYGTNSVNLTNVSLGKIRKDTLYVDANGVLSSVSGFEVSNQTLWNNVPLKPLAANLMPVAIVHVGTQGTNGSLGVTDTSTLLLDNLIVGTSSTSSDIIISYQPSSGATANQITFTFAGTKNSDNDVNYKKTRLNHIFNVVKSQLIQNLSISKVGLTKTVLNNIQFVTAADQNKSITITVAPNQNVKNINPLQPEIYFVDDELTFKGSALLSFGTKTNDNSSSGEYGVVSKNSTLYKQFADGNINSGDYFYPYLFDYSFAKIEFYNLNGNDTIDFYYNSGDIDYTKFISRKIRIFGTTGNDKIFTVLNVSDNSIVDPDYTNLVSIIVNESVKTETITAGIVDVAGASETDIRYLKMYLINNDLNVEYTQDKDLVGANSLDVTPSSGYNLSSIKVFSDKSSYKQTLEIESIVESNKILVSADRYGEVKIGDYLEALVDETTLQLGEVPKKITRILNKVLYSGDSTLVEITTDAAIKINTFGVNNNDMQTTRYTTIEDYVNTYNAIVLGGFKMRADSMPDGSEKRQNDILNMIAVGTPLFKGLINRNKLSWRYLVDCWGNGLTSNSKQQFVDLCGQKLTCLSFINMPSARAFKNSTLTSFIDPINKTLRYDFIRKGGDPNSSPAFLYSFGQGVGQSNAAYFFPYVTIDDSGRPLDVPPAAYVCNTFMRKHLTRLASVKPWTIAAGITNGFLTGFGNVEVDILPDDVSELNQMNANPITYKMNRGFCIETNNTAQVSPRSSLSYISSREVLIDLENELYEMLLTYIWQFNTAEIRAEIKGKADAICERFVRENGLYAFRNTMDESNNTSELIDAQIGVIDTAVEIVKGLQNIVNRITIFKTGDINSTGFGV